LNARPETGRVSFLHGNCAGHSCADKHVWRDLVGQLSVHEGSPRSIVTIAATFRDRHHRRPSRRRRLDRSASRRHSILSMARGDKSQRPMRMPTAISVARIAKTIATMRPVVIAFLLHACANLPLAPLSFSSRSGCRALAFYISVAAWPRLPAADFLKMISNGMTASIAIIKSL
jgi:hypothetical protein